MRACARVTWEDFVKRDLERDCAKSGEVERKTQCGRLVENGDRLFSPSVKSRNSFKANLRGFVNMINPIIKKIDATHHS